MRVRPLLSGLRAHPLHLPAAISLFSAALIVTPWAVQAESPWLLEAAGFVAAPLAPEVFTDGWGPGLGIGGGLCLRVRSNLKMGLEADFVQFKFEGLEGFAPLGGERRCVRLAVPLELAVWERRSPGRERLALRGSAGWVRETIDGTFGSDALSADRSADGLAITAEVRFSRSLFRSTRWSVGIRSVWLDLPDESPRYASFNLGLSMPLDGSR